MSRYEKMNEIDKAREKYLKASAVKDALKSLWTENKDNFDEHANLVVSAAYMKAAEEFGEAGADYHRLKDEFEEDGRYDESWQDSELSLYGAEQAEKLDRGY